MTFAHGVGSVYESPIPLSVYLFGAAATVVASFLVRGLAGPRLVRRPRMIGGPRPAAGLIMVFRVVGLVTIGLIILFGIFLSEEYFRFAALLFWVVLIVATVLLCSLVQGLWERANPWKTIEDLYLLGDRHSRRRQPPAWIGPFLVFALFWFELVSGVGFEPAAVAAVLIVYSLCALSLRPVLGDAWELADPLSILFGFAGRVAPFRLDESGIAYRGMLAGLDEESPMPRPLFAALFVLLSSTTFDNLSETVQWYDLLHWSGLAGSPDRLIGTVAFVFLVLPFLLSFLGAVWFARRVTDDPGLTAVARRFAWSLVPIAVAYVIAHNLPLVFTGLPQLAEPLLPAATSYEPSPGLIWFLEIALIVGGHVLGVLAAHRTAERLAKSPSRAMSSHAALTVLMSLYTIATLWLLSLPLVAA